MAYHISIELACELKEKLALVLFPNFELCAALKSRLASIHMPEVRGLEREHVRHSGQLNGFWQAAIWINLADGAV